MLNAHINALLHDSLSDLFIDLNSHCSLGNVEYNSGTSVVVFKWHSFVDSTIGHNIYVVSNLLMRQSEGDKLPLEKLSFRELLTLMGFRYVARFGIPCWRNLRANMWRVRARYPL